MPITINHGMLDKITDDTDDGWDDGDNIITFAIDVDPGSYDYNPFGDPLNIIGTSADNKLAIQEAVLLWDDVMARGLAYSNGNDDADITINTAGGFAPGVGGVTYSTIHSILPNDADTFLRDNPIAIGNSAWTTVLHEFGHALGLQHPGDYDASDGEFTYQNDRSYDEDTVQFSIMSYFEPSNYNPGIKWTNSIGPQTPMVYDILAIQAYYGVDTITRTGDTTYGFNSTAGRSVFDFEINTRPVVTIWDAGGIDTLDLSGFADDQQVYLEEGMYSDVGGDIQNVAIAFGVLIENATGGSGKDLIVGNNLNNRLLGLAGDDALQGNDGNDTLDGGEGNDTLIGNGGSDVLTGGIGDDQLFGNDQNDILTGGAGGDVLSGGAGFDIALYDAPGGENITIRPKDAALGQWTVTGAAQASGDTLTQIEAFRFGAGDDIIKTVGSTASVSFDLDGGAGNDLISGGDGTDTLIGGNGTDVLNPGAGVFHVYGGLRGLGGIGLGESLAANDMLVLDHSGQSGDYSLRFSGPGSSGSVGTFSDMSGSTATGIGRLSYTGGSGADAISGGIGNDYINAGDGNDTLTGGAGTDLLKGGLGQDYLYGGEGNDRLETGGGGDRYVYGEAGNDTLVGSNDAESLDGGADADKLYGYDGADYLSGGTGDDRIVAGDGADFLYGGDGNDTLQGGDGDDYVDAGQGVETLDGGIGNDTLRIGRDLTTKGVTFSLNGAEGSDGTTSKNFEMLNYAAGSGGDTVQGWNNADSIYGNGGNDTLIGLGGNDTLTGGAGTDLLKGGLGQDYLYGGEGNDRLETGGGGDRYVYGEAGNDTLVGSNDAESLDGGADADKLYGYGGADYLTGGTGNDILDGGLGNDVLTGGGGKDTFVFTTSLRPANVDHITDFVVVDDTIWLDADMFEGLIGGVLSGNAFKETSTGGRIDASDRILYDKAIGALLYDADGSGKAFAALEFAILDNKALLAASDFLIV
jgi:serralysin